MIFKENEKYFGINFGASYFTAFARKVGLKYTYDNGTIKVDDKDIPAAVNKGLEFFAECSNNCFIDFADHRVVALVLLMATSLSKAKDEYRRKLDILLLRVESNKFDINRHAAYLKSLIKSIKNQDNEDKAVEETDRLADKLISIALSIY